MCHIKSAPFPCKAWERNQPCGKGASNLTTYYDTYICSDWHRMFCKMGNPQLDIKLFRDGEWAIREFYRSPVVPAQTPWKYVLTGLKNIEISESFIKRYLWQIDPTNRGFWERQQQLTNDQNAQRDRAESDKIDRHMQIGKELSKNDSLIRDAKIMGPAAFDLERIGRKIYKHQPWKLGNL